MSQPIKYEYNWVFSTYEQPFWIFSSDVPHFSAGRKVGWPPAALSRGIHKGLLRRKVQRDLAASRGRQSMAILKKPITFQEFFLWDNDQWRISWDQWGRNQWRFLAGKTNDSRPGSHVQKIHRKIVRFGPNAGISPCDSPRGTERRFTHLLELDGDFSSPVNFDFSIEKPQIWWRSKIFRKTAVSILNKPASNTYILWFFQFFFQFFFKMFNNPKAT